MTSSPATSDVATASSRRTSPIRVRKLGHLVYEVSDIDRSRAFWTDVMGFRVTEVGANGMVFLRCASDHHSIGLKQSKTHRRRPDPDAGLMIEHLAMELANLDALFEARDWLKSNGVPIHFEGRKYEGSSFSVYFRDPDNYLFEVYCDLDQIDESGKVRPAAQFRPARSLEEAASNPLPLRW